jgi:hypothetical protein
LRARHDSTKFFEKAILPDISSLPHHRMPETSVGPSCGHGLHGIDNKILDYLLDLTWISLRIILACGAY